MNKFLIDVFQLFASYKLIAAAKATAIAEREYASAEEIKFTPFTSCIGVIAKEGATLTAVHLTVLDDKEHKFCTIDAARVIGCLPTKPDKVKIVGCIDVWLHPDNKVQAAFEKLTGSLKNLQTLNWGDGTYGAKINGAEIDVYKAWA